MRENSIHYSLHSLEVSVRNLRQRGSEFSSIRLVYYVGRNGERKVAIDMVIDDGLILPRTHPHELHAA